jgi:hypothetical protein
MSEWSGDGAAPGRRREPEDEATLVPDAELEAIRRQLDAEYGVEIRRPIAVPVRKRGRSSVIIQWALTVVAGVLMGGVAAILATALYVKITEPPPSAVRPGPVSTRAASTSGGPVQSAAPAPPALPPITASGVPSAIPAGATTVPTADKATANTRPLESAQGAPLPREPLRGQPSSTPPDSNASSTNPKPGEPARPQGESTSVQNRLAAATPDSSRKPDAGAAGRVSSSSPPSVAGTEQARLATRPDTAIPSGSDARVAGPGVGMARYSDPYGRFGIEYPAGWRVRTAATGTKGTTFYLDDPDEGIAVRVLPQAALQGNLNGAALAPIVSQQTRQRYPDFRITALSSRPLAAGGEQSEFSAVWTNRWAQRMRSTGVIVSVARGTETNYLYISAQAQELVFPGLEAILQRVMYSLRPAPPPG